ncbi:hypothetical protein Arad_14018 (plasmid) [Rhizobium rhizogenes K84]|uniref:Acetyltransferase protein n=1 Tax=Rhizobium rhizogenes (strain K84 / ATCC BAA-868) TaxID=311403 RepID=B9JP58_RHIR8|nr:hypothetical protein Arad_14018 [Rhizobium rhizogenes K84]
MIPGRALGSSPQALAFYQTHGFVESGREAIDLLDTLTAEAIVMSAYVENLRTRFA